ncbi:HNH endonuclease family protein, partial [Roseovarius sp. D0-M9]|uniref:HNH endonuclease family protein n=1 Tax=Roseovarius sp. D0-M9 TaxID=3127117 RepID=UPI00300FEAE0
RWLRSPRRTRLPKARNMGAAQAPVRPTTHTEREGTKLRERVPSPTEFNAGFEQILFTKSNASQRALVRYILQKVFSFEGVAAIGNSSDLTIEHLHPQAEIGGEFTAGIVGQVGNLILVDPKTNDKLGMKPYAEKKKILLDKGYKLPVDFLEADALSPELIKGNTLRISELARTQVWRV